MVSTCGPQGAASDNVWISLCFSILGFNINSLEKVWPFNFNVYDKGHIQKLQDSGPQGLQFDTTAVESDMELHLLLLNNTLKAGVASETFLPNHSAAYRSSSPSRNKYYRENTEAC